MVTSMLSNREEIYNIKTLNRVSLYVKLLLCLVAFSVLGGTNDTILAKNQLGVIGLYILYCVAAFRRKNYPLTRTIRNVTEHSIVLLILFVASALYSIDTAMTLRMSLTTGLMMHTSQPRISNSRMRRHWNFMFQTEERYRA